MDILPIIFLSLLTPILIYFLINKVYYSENSTNTKSLLNLIPSPRGLPLIGNLHQLGSYPHESLSKLARIHGPVMLLRLGKIPALVVSSSEAAKSLMKTHDLESCSRPDLSGSRGLTYSQRDLAFSPYGQYWREIRKIWVLELFSLKRVKSYWPAREREVVKMVADISGSFSSAVDLTETAFSFTAGVIFRVGFGMSFEETGFDRRGFDEVVQEVATSMGSYSAAEMFPCLCFGRALDWVSGLDKRRAETFRKMDGLFQRAIDNHRRESLSGEKENDDVIHVFLKIMEDKSGFGATLTDENVKAVLLNTFLGGIDTSAITIVWAMAELIKNPKLMKKAQDEIRGCFEKTPEKSIINETDIAQLVYLKAIIKETFRLHPPATLLVPRETISQFNLSGFDFDFDIPPKTLVLVNAWAIQRDPKIWKDPEEFVPERFLESHAIDYKGHHFELLPFGSGRRICPAVYMGASSVELGLANLLYSFDWELPHGMTLDNIDMEESPGFSLTTFKRTPLELVPVKHYH